MYKEILHQWYKAYNTPSLTPSLHLIFVIDCSISRLPRIVVTLICNKIIFPMYRVYLLYISYKSYHHLMAKESVKINIDL